VLSGLERITADDVTQALKHATPVFIGILALQLSGRTWDRNEPGPDRLGTIWADFEPLLQGLLVDVRGNPVSLSTTGFHSALGQIRDKLAAPGELRRLLDVLLRELGAR